ncbi:MAG: hypothetical protein HOY71_20695, partial [Nonomuraea sp.]|nr:hypothetical protein [Nonomuraea sp.]
MRRTLIAAALLSLAACGTAMPDTITAAGVARENPAQAPVEETVRGLTAFGDRLYQASADPAKNVVLSPLSIGYAFGMARAGASPQTGTELDRLFGFPAQGPHTAFNRLTRQIVTIEGPPPAPATEPESGEERKPKPPIVGIANGLFVQQGFAVKEPFLRTLAAQYGVGVHPVDFGGDAADVINKWAEEQTAGRIKHVLDKAPSDTKAAITNALYLKAEWKHTFEDGAKQAAFTRADGSVVRADLMQLREPLRYASGPGWQAVELPYA